ncbi:MAG TPA: cbb3-type cytochrome oxidase assembly protein CcoS [Caldithrix abyssi]|uniref:Cbb3-type cytochrome oxidase assembly protein CcoS n=1 Tax=Caldithrix abyssi TaxID=187145 RepID=A0A7V4TX92_CALAY|nr:cbb3-type cytochrome oxidase assembly protein CcoS [Caldithrix abyssi]
MSVIVILISASLFVAIGFLVAFIWAIKSGQFDDKYTPSIRMLLDEKKDKEEGASNNKSYKSTKGS